MLVCSGGRYHESCHQIVVKANAHESCIELCMSTATKANCPLEPIGIRMHEYSLALSEVHAAARLSMLQLEIILLHW